MRARVVAGGILSSAAVLVIGWQLGGQTAVSTQTTTPAAGGTTSGGSTAGGTGSGSGSGTTGSGSTDTGGSSGAASTPSPSASAGSGTSSTGSGVSGTFDGTTVETQFGPMQVAIVVSDGTITDVTALQTTDEGGRSVEISASAVPILRREALSAQSADIQSVSGATYTSDGYTTSLQSAIDKAGL